MSVIQEIEAFREAVDQAKRKVRCVCCASLSFARARVLSLSLSRFVVFSFALALSPSRARSLSLCLSFSLSLNKQTTRSRTCLIQATETQKIARTKPLLANEATANWQAYVKGNAKKKQKKREREAGGLDV